MTYVGGADSDSIQDCADRKRGRHADRRGEHDEPSPRQNSLSIIVVRTALVKFCARLQTSIPARLRRFDLHLIRGFNAVCHVSPASLCQTPQAVEYARPLGSIIGVAQT